MNGEAHIIEIDSILLEGVSHLRPAEVQALVQAEVRRALLGTHPAAAREMATTETAVGEAVAQSVDRSVSRGAGDG